MKVVHLCTHDFGGAAMAAIQLHEELLKEGVDSSILTLVKSRNDIPSHYVTNGFDTMKFPMVGRMLYKINSALVKFGFKNDKRNFPSNKHLLNRPAGREIFSLPYSYFNICDYPLVMNADVIHLHWVSYSMIDYGKFFNSCKAKIVWTLHDMYAFTGGCHHADECIGFQVSCNVCPQLKDNKFASIWFNYKRDALSAIRSENLKLISPSVWMSKNVSKSSLFSKYSSNVIPNGFNTEVFFFKESAPLREKLNLPIDKVLFLFNAYDVTNKRKGIVELMQAFSGLDQSKVALICIGNKFDLASQDLDVFIVGYIQDREVLSDYYNACDYFILPSKAENLPNTIVESLLCGTPVIAFDIGGVPELITEENGILISEISAEKLLIGMEKAILAKSKFNRISISRNAKKKYDIKFVAHEHLKVYKSFGL